MIEQKPIVIVGGGGHARVAADMVRALGIPIYGVVDPDRESVALRLPTEKLLFSNDDEILKLDRNEIHLVMGVGARPGSSVRRSLFDKFTSEGFYFPPIVHPAACVANDVLLAPGAQIMAGATVQPGTQFGPCSIANTQSSIDHECKIGDFAHIAPGAVICGCVSIGSHSFVGPGAIVTHNVTVGEGAILGAGSVVLKSVPEATTFWGVPARDRLGSAKRD